MGKITFKIKTLKGFADKYSREKLYTPGEILTTDEIDRVNNIVALGLGELVSVEQLAEPKTNIEDATKTKAVPEKSETAEAKVVSVNGTEYELNKVKAALNAIGVKTAANTGVEKVSEKVSALSEEQLAELNLKLSE